MELTLTEMFAAVATGISAVSAISQGQQQGRMMGYQAAVQEQQAAREREIAAQQASEFERKQSDLMAKRRAALGATGVQPGTGSPLLVSQDFAAETQYQKLLLEAGGEDRATRLEQSAALSRMGGKSKRAAGFARGGALLFQGASESGLFDKVE